MPLFFLVFIFSGLGSLCSEEQAATLDLQLRDRGQTLYQTRTYGPAEAPKAFFLLKQVFPAGASTAIDESGNTNSSFVSPDKKFRMYGTFGQAATGTSEDTANFRVTSGFFASARRSSFRVQSVTERKNPVVAPRSTR